MTDASTTNDTGPTQLGLGQSKQANALDIDLRDLDAALEAAGIYVDVEARDGSLILSGEVDSAEMRQAAFDLGGVIAQRHGLRLEDAIDVLDIEVEMASGERGDIGPATLNASDAMGDTVYDVGTIDAGLAGEEAIPYFPPTDPVIGQQLTEQDEVEVIGGFQPTSLYGDDETNVRPNDDERISDDVRRELREDATTTDLRISVETRNRVVYLRGEVAALEDSDNAEAVAGQVAGVDEVRNEIDTVGPIGDRREP